MGSKRSGQLAQMYPRHGTRHFHQKFRPRSFLLEAVKWSASALFPNKSPSCFIDKPLWNPWRPVAL